jgi:integrase
MAPRDADLALERRVLHIRQAVVPVGGVAQIGPTKNGRSRAIHGIYPSVLAALREHKARQNERRLEMGPLWRDHGLVFCSEVGTPIQPRNLARDYDRWVARAGVPRICIHDQRHTNASGAPSGGGRRLGLAAAARFSPWRTHKKKTGVDSLA